MPECEWGAENSCLGTYHLGGGKTEAVMKFHYHFFDNDDANGGCSILGIFTPFARPFRQQKPPRKAEKRGLTGKFVVAARMQPKDFQELHSMKLSLIS